MITYIEFLSKQLQEIVETYINVQKYSSCKFSVNSSGYENKKNLFETKVKIKSKRRNSRIDSQLPRTVYYLHLVHAFKIHQYDCGQYRIQCYLLRPLDTDYLYPDDPNHDTSTTQIMQTALYH